MSHDWTRARWSAAAARAAKVTGVGLLVLVGLHATTTCRSSVDAVVSDTTVYQVTIATSQAWAGGSLVLMSRGFKGADTAPLILLGEDTLATRYAALDSLLVSLPDTQGHFEVRVGFSGRPITLAGSVDLYGGYSGLWTMYPVGGHPVAWPGGGGASFAIARDSGLAQVDPELQTVTRVLPDSVFSISCINGVGPAANGRIAVAGNQCQWLVAVRPDSPSVAPDTGPSIFAGSRFAAQLAPGRWLLAYHHGVSSFWRNSTGAWVAATTPYHIEEPYEVVVSPRGDRAVVLGKEESGLGMPVFGLGSPEPAYLLAQFAYVYGAQFSPDGDTLFVVGYPAGTDATPVLAAIAASDGTILKSAPTSAGCCHLVLDQGHPWIYLVGSGVHVYDHVTLAHVATLKPRVPPGVDISGDGYSFLSPVERKLYVVQTCSFCGAGSVPVLTFDLVP